MTEGSRTAVVDGYRDVVVRKYFRIDLEGVVDEDDAESKAIERIEMDGVDDYLDHEEEVDWYEVTIDDVELSQAVYVAKVEIKIEADTIEDARSEVENVLYSFLDHHIITLQEEN